MQLRTLFEHDDAVSPVIGVILMVAITVILAAVIGTFVLGLGDQVSNTAPSASFEFQYSQSGGSGTCSFGGSGPYVDITHKSGDEVPADQVTITDGDSTHSWNDCASTSVSDITAGDTASADVASDDTLRILWEKDDDSTTLSIWDAPDA